MLPRTAILATVTLALIGGTAAAQTAWPNRPVKIVVPSPPSGSGDMLGRLVAQRFQEAFGQPFQIDNRPGGGNLLGAEIVAKSPPDGYTLLVSGIASNVVAPAVNAAALTFDPMKDFTHIALFGGSPGVLAVAPNLAVKNLGEFLALAKEKPGAISYGTPGIGTHSHLVMELLQQRTGTKMTNVPYRGAAQAVADLMGGHIPAASMTLTSAAGQIKAGAVRGIAITSAQRVPEFPDIPTYAELGFPELTATTWFALSGPAGLPADIVTRLNAEVIKALQQPDIRQRLDREAIHAEPLSPAQFTAFVQAEINRWTPIAKASGAKPE